MTIKQCQFVLNKKGLHNLQHIKIEGGTHKAKKKKIEGDEESLIFYSKCLNNSTKKNEAYWYSSLCLISSSSTHGSIFKSRTKLLASTLRSGKLKSTSSYCILV